jgi:hypothetical protein
MSYSSSSQSDEWRLIRTVPYRTFLVTGTSELWIYETTWCS